MHVEGDESSSGWWRWPLVPIGAIAGGLAASMFFYALQWFAMKMQGGFSEDGWWFLYIMPVMQSAVLGWAYTQCAANIAPRGKFIAAVVMATLLIASLVVLNIVGWMRSSIDWGLAVRVTISSVAVAVACVITLMQIHEEHG